MSRLDKAIQLATEVHAGQVDKGGNPYILHPLRVMCAVEKQLVKINKDYVEDYLCVSVLHDVIEDYDESKYNIDEVCDLVHDCGDTVYLEVMTLTRVSGESWNKYINKVYGMPMRRVVKIHDLEDNCDLTRLKEVTNDDINRNNMYIRARNFLERGKGKL